MANTIRKEYQMSLDDLTFNSKPHINALTMLAEEYLLNADLIVDIIEAQINKARPECRLPIMYLKDSIVKNVGGNYTPLFAKNIVRSFHLTFDTGDEKTKVCLHKLRSTWDDYFPLKKLHEVDVTIHAVDPNWPVKPLPPHLQDKLSTSIHVNPKFLKKAETSAVSANSISQSSFAASSATLLARKSAAATSSDSVDLKQDLINKQKQLLEIQQQKLLLELEQTKRELALRERRNHLLSKQSENTPLDPRRKNAVAVETKSPAGLRAGLPNGNQQKLQHQNVGATKTKNVSKDPRTQNENRPKVTSIMTKPIDSVATTIKEVTGIKQTKSKKVDASKKANISKSSSGEEKDIKSPIASEKSKVPKSPLKSGGKKNKLNKDKALMVKAAKKSPNNNKNFLKGSKQLESNISKNKEEQPSKKSSKPEKAKKRDRMPKRPSPHAPSPPAKQPRRSTSLERRRSPPRRALDPPRKGKLDKQQPRHMAVREGERKRGKDSPRSTDGSISPRFSPEPEEPEVHRDRGMNWRPPAKRWAGAMTVDHRAAMDHRPIARRRSSVDPNLRIPQELTLSHQAEILKQAEIQLQTGQLTHSQHQELLKQLHQLFELQRLRNLQIMSQELAEHGQPLPIDKLIREQKRKEAMEQRAKEMEQKTNLMELDMHEDSFNMNTFRPPSPPVMDESRNQPLHRTNSAEMPPEDLRRGRFNLREEIRVHPPHIRDPRIRNAPEQFNDEFQRNRGGRLPKRHEDFSPRPEEFAQGRTSYGSPDLEDQHRRMREERRLQIPERKPDSFKKDLIHPPSNTRPYKNQEKKGASRRHSQGDREDGNKLSLRVYARPEIEKDDVSEKENEIIMERSPEAVDKPNQNENVNCSKEESESESFSPVLEEPEDYIIAAIPQSVANAKNFDEQAYRDHSRKLKRDQTEAEKAYQDHRRNLLLAAYKKQYSAEALKTKSDSESAEDNELLAKDVLTSPEMMKDKSEEEINKSPSLPLKKRKYVNSGDENIDVSNELSSGDIKTDSGDALTDLEVDQIKSDSDNTDLRTDDICPESENIPEVPPKSEESRVPEKTHDTVNDEQDGEVVSDKDAEELKTDEEPVKEINEVKEEMESVGETQHEVMQIDMNNDAMVPDNTVQSSDDIEQEDVLPESKHIEHSTRERRPIEREWDRGKRPGRRFRQDGPEFTPPHNDEDARLQAIMREDEDRRQWEAELAKQLEIEQLEHEMKRNREVRHPVPEHHPERGAHISRRGWNRDEEKPWNRRWERGPFRRGNRPGGRGWRRDEPWNEEMDDPNRFPPGGPVEDRFHGRPRPERMLAHPHRMRHPHWREDRIDEPGWFGARDQRDEFRPREMRGRGPPRPEFDRRPPIRGERTGPMLRRPEGPLDDRFGPGPSMFHPDDRMPIDNPRFHEPDVRRGGDSPGRKDVLPPQQQPQELHESQMNQISVNKLLKELLNMGIIPGHKSEDIAVGSSPSSRNDSPVPSEVKVDVKLNAPVEPVMKPGVAEPLKATKSNKALDLEKQQQRVPTPVFFEDDLMNVDPDVKLPLLTLKNPDLLKKRHDNIITRLYTGIQCSACGMRFTSRQTDMYAEHLDWHYRLNRKDRDGIKDTHRLIFPTAGQWIMYEEIGDPNRVQNPLFDDGISQDSQAPEPTQEIEDPEKLVVPVTGRANEDRCEVCKESFKTVYNDEDDEWQFLNCVTVDEINFHPSCYADHNDNPDFLPMPTPVRVSLYNPIEDSLKGIPGLDSLTQEDDEMKNPEQGMMGESDDDDDAVGGDLETSLDIKQDSTDEENKALQDVPSTNEELENDPPQKCFLDLPQSNPDAPIHSMPSNTISEELVLDHGEIAEEDHPSIADPESNEVITAFVQESVKSPQSPIASELSSEIGQENPSDIKQQPDELAAEEESVNIDSIQSLNVTTDKETDNISIEDRPLLESATANVDDCLDVVSTIPIILESYENPNTENNATVIPDESTTLAPDSALDQGTSESISESDLSRDKEISVDDVKK